VWVCDGKVKIERFEIGRKEVEDFEEVEECERFEDMGDSEGRVVFPGRKRKVHRCEWREEIEYFYFLIFFFNFL
jgi:hypothetical protein